MDARKGFSPGAIFFQYYPQKYDSFWCDLYVLGGLNHGGDLLCGWVVVMLCDPRFFIRSCSFKKAWCQLLPRTMQTAHGRRCDLFPKTSIRSKYLFCCCLKLSLKCASKHWMVSIHLHVLPMHHCLSLSLLHHIHAFPHPPSCPLDSKLPDNKGMIQLC